jgi:hypothetical protein
MWSSVSRYNDRWKDSLIFPVLLLFSLLALFTSFVGLTGTLLSSRPILAFYCLLLWPTFISLALVGYSSFKRANVQLDRKLNQVWSQFLSEEDRLRIQNGLGCCGYYNPFRTSFCTFSANEQTMRRTRNGVIPGRLWQDVKRNGPPSRTNRFAASRERHSVQCLYTWSTS